MEHETSAETLCGKTPGWNRPSPSEGLTIRRTSRPKRLPLPSWTSLLYWGLLLALLYLFAELADEVHSRETVAFDAPILAWLTEHRTGLLTQVALFLDLTGSIYLLGPVSLLIAAWLWRFRRRAAVFLVLSMAGAWGLNLAAKVLVGRLRPELFDRLSIAPGYSFPSGHTMVSTAFFLTLFLISWRSPPRDRWLVGSSSALLIFAVGASRSYLQVHYPSDVLAGWLLSGAWVLGLNSWFRRPSGRRRLDPAAQPDDEVDDAAEDGSEENGADAKDRHRGGG